MGQRAATDNDAHGFLHLPSLPQRFADGRACFAVVEWVRAMNLLALDTSTEVMSVAVQRGGAGDAQVWQSSAVGGAQTSVSLISTIQALMAQAQLEFHQLTAIVFGRGPGSFTGLRSACSVAQGLAFATGAQVLPINTLLALAEEARWQHSATLSHWRVIALLDARMDQLYAARFEYQSQGWQQIGGDELIWPQDLVCDAQWDLAGNVFAAYGQRLGVSKAQRLDALPTAAALLRLAPGLLAGGAGVSAELALPLYVRDKVAQTSLERTALKGAT